MHDEYYPPWNQQQKHPKMDGFWRRSGFLLGFGLFSGAFAVSFKEANQHHQQKGNQLGSCIGIIVMISHYKDPFQPTRISLLSLVVFERYSGDVFAHSRHRSWNIPMQPQAEGWRTGTKMGSFWLGGFRRFLVGKMLENWLGFIGDDIFERNSFLF